MGAFHFQALDSAGQVQKGVLQAETVRAARSLLRERGLNPLEVAAVQEESAEQGQWNFRRGMSSAQLAILSRQLATLVGAGLPMDEALAALGEAAGDNRSRSIIVTLRSRVMEGQSLASALGEFPDSFPEVFRASVEAGESSGNLDVALVRLADYSEGREELSRRIWLALAYPILLSVVALAVVSGLMVYVVPQVVQVFVNLGHELPLITRILIAISDFFRAYAWLVLIAIAVSAQIIYFLLRKPAFREKFDQFTLRLPLIGRLIRASNTARATHTLATVISSGVPVLEAMRLAAQTIHNRPMQLALRRASARVREGVSFAKALIESNQFPPVALRLIASGEKSGKLETMLDQAARYQTREVDGLLGTMTAVLGPLVILLVGGLVLFIVLAILLPIFQLNDLIR